MKRVVKDKRIRGLACNVERLIIVNDLPPRSRLFHLAPLGIGPPLVESLTSYINRLAWMYRISPRMLVIQEVIPQLPGSYQFTPSQLSASLTAAEMRINGAGEVAVNWSTTLERLTMRADLRYLNVHVWASGLPTRTLLRETPAWCPICYQEWQKDDHPIYQPLLWMLQVVTICLKHKKKLESRCPHCHRLQAVIASVVQPAGHCTWCKAWLGTMRDMAAGDEIDDDTLAWQEWAVRVIEELHRAGTSSGVLSWEDVPFALDVYRKIVGGSKQLAQMANVPEVSLSRWVTGKNMPSLESLLKLCYVLDISLLQLMTYSSSDLEEVMKTKINSHSPRPRNPKPLSKDQKPTLELIKAVLDGREAPQSVPQIERRLGLGRTTIVYHYPEEAALVSAQYQAYCREKRRRLIEHLCDEVRAATYSLYAQEIFPSQSRVRALLSDPNRMLEPEVRNAWRAARRELGLES